MYELSRTINRNDRLYAIWNNFTACTMHIVVKVVVSLIFYVLLSMKTGLGLTVDERGGGNIKEIRFEFADDR